MENLKYLLKAIADILLPRVCAVCGKVLEIRENHLCIYCMADFPFTFYWKMKKNPMADRLNEKIQSAISQEDTDSPPFEPYSFAAALFFYKADSGYREITRQIKYHGNTGIGKYFGSILGERLLDSDFMNDIDMIVPVPLHPTRKWSRGYNQASVIAKGISSVTDAPVAENVLKRKRRTKSQTRLDIEAKSRNVSGAFSVRESVARKYAPRHILIVDDVFTTGATINACHRELRRFYGTQTKISAATLGYTG